MLAVGASIRHGLDALGERERKPSMNALTPEIERRELRIPPEVRALLLALQTSEADTRALAQLSDEEWATLLAFCNIAHLTLPLAQLSTKGFPNWVIDRLRTNLADNALRFERVKSTYHEAARALRQAGIEHVVVKGFTQSPDYVPNPRLRAQSDIDIFCPSESIDDAYVALQAIGYKPSSAKINYARADHREPLIRLENWQWKGNPFDPDMPLGIELHFCLWNQFASGIPVPETNLFWDRRTARQVEGLSFSCLSPVDQLAYLTLHILRNIFLADWVIHLVRELSVFLHSRADDHIFWRQWNKSYSSSLRSMQAIAFYYGRAWFGCRLHPLAAQEIDRLPALLRSWLGAFSGSALEIMFRLNKDSLWLQLILISSPKEKLKIIKRTLLPVPIGSIDSPTVRVRNKRLARSSGSSPLRQYIDYLISRSATHGRASLATLRRGLLWRVSQHFLAP
jgi:hypothetical protein